MNEKISIRQVISALNKGGDLPQWLSIADIKSTILALREGKRSYTGQEFIAYAILDEDETTLSNILFIKSSRDATALLRLMAGGDE